MTKASGKIRIIGGSYRSRIIQFPAIPGLRPTSDRLRETLFNWLAPYIRNARCLDLFAGSGVLGFEAISRGAAHVTFVDKSNLIIQHLKKYALLFNEEKIHIIKSNVPTEYPIFTHTFDIIFLDPPFRKNLIAPTCHWLEKQNCLAKKALIYIEVEAELENIEVPTHWLLLKSKRAGQVKYYLWENT